MAGIDILSDLIAQDLQGNPVFRGIQRTAMDEQSGGLVDRDEFGIPVNDRQRGGLVFVMIVGRQGSSI